MYYLFKTVKRTPWPYFTYAKIAGSASSWRRHSYIVQLIRRLNNLAINFRHITSISTFSRHQVDLIFIYIHILGFFYVVNRGGEQVEANCVIRFATTSILLLPCATNIPLNN